MTPNLDIDLLKTFLAIAESGSFTQAAGQVNKTQGAVSMQMKRLEETTGRNLFTRDGRQSRLSPDGERMREFAERLVRLNDEAMASFTKPELTGVVRLGTPDDYSDRLLPEVLARFSRSHPLVQVNVDCLSSEILAEKIARDELDLAVVSCSKNTAGAEVIRKEPLLWVTSIRHRAHEAEVLPIAVSQRGCVWRDMVLAALEKHGRPYRIAYASANSNAVNAAILTGLAIGAVPAIVARPGMRELTPREGFQHLGTFDIGLLQSPTAQAGAVAALSDHIRDSMCACAFAPQIAAE